MVICVSKPRYVSMNVLVSTTKYAYMCVLLIIKMMSFQVKLTRSINLSISVNGKCIYQKIQSLPLYSMKTISVPVSFKIRLLYACWLLDNEIEKQSHKINFLKKCLL